MPPSLALAIEISNPSSGPRGPIPGWHAQHPGVARPASGASRACLAGPGVALARLNPDGSLTNPDTELLNESGRHDDDLMPAIDRLFRRAGARPADLARIAISIGPGGYTSLRIAVATAKMLAESTGAGVIPIPSAHVAVFCIPPEPGPTIVCLASKGQTVHATLLPPPPSDWWPRIGRRAAASLLPPQSAAQLDLDLASGKSWIAASCTLGLIGSAELESLRPAAIIADRFLPDSIRESASRLGARIIEPIFAASSLLSLAQHAPGVDPLALAPLYPRQAEAVTQWRLRRPG